jgi:hypothetical protein
MGLLQEGKNFFLFGLSDLIEVYLGERGLQNGCKESVFAFDICVPFDVFLDEVLFSLIQINELLEFVELHLVVDYFEFENLKNLLIG